MLSSITSLKPKITLFIGSSGSSSDACEVLRLNNTTKVTAAACKIVNNEEKLENFKNPESFEDMLDLLLKNRESLLHAQLINNVHLISFEQLNIKLRLKFKSDTEILKNLSSTLEKITKNKWNVTHSEEDGEKTIVEKQNIKLNEQKQQIKTNPHFAEIFKHFPQAEITSIEDKKSN